MAACILTACKDKNEFTLTGTFENSNYNGTFVYLKQINPDFSVSDVIDSVIVDNSRFEFKDIAQDVPAVHLIVINESVMPATFIGEKGKIEMNFDSKMKPTVKGTALNDKYQHFETERINLIEQIYFVRNKYSEIKEAGNLSSEQFRELDKLFKQLWEDLENVIFNYIKSNITNNIGKWLLGSESSLYLKDSKLKELLSLTSADFRNIKSIQLWEKQIDAREATAIGKPFVNVKGLNFNDKEVSLSDYAGKGKIILIDFWASWCGPCIREMQDLIAVYQQYRNKGFEIVGISLDIEKESWKKMTDDLKITWPQFSNVKGWEEEAAAAYGVNSIPHAVLIDKGGIIIERGLSVDALKFKLEELFGSK